MNEEVDRLLGQLRDVSTPMGLEDRILLTVRRDARRRRAVTGATATLLAPAALLLFWSARLLAADLSASSLLPLLAEAGDWRRVMTVFGDWGLALVEALPVGSLALTLTAAVALVAIVGRLLRLSAPENPTKEVLAK